MKTIVTILFTLFVVGCNKPRVEPLPPFNPCAIIPCDTSKLEIVWQRPIWADTMELSSMSAYIEHENVIFSQGTFSLTDTIKFLNKKTGSENFVWADYFQGRSASMTSCDPVQIENKIVFTTGNDVYAIRATDGKTMWRTKIETGVGDPFLNKIGNTVFHGRYDRRNATNYASYLVAANANTGIWDTIHTQRMINNYQPFHEKPALWVNSKGDSILIFEINFLDINLGANGYKTDIVAVNLQSREEYFRLEDIDKVNSGSRRYPYIVGNYAFVPLGANMVCIDMTTKNIKWRRTFDAGFTSGQPFIYVENKFFVKPDNRTLYQLDLETGNILWQDWDNGSGASDMVYYNGCFTTPALVMVKFTL